MVVRFGVIEMTATIIIIIIKIRGTGGPFHSLAYYCVLLAPV